MNEPAASLRVALQVAVTSEDVPEEAECTAWIAAALSCAEPVPEGAVTVRLVDEREGAALNSTYRQKSGATNVLAFPGPQDALPVTDEVRELGDLVICWPVACREAAAQGKTVLNHCAHLVVHGTLHLIGYDHEQAEDAGHMEQLEIRALNSVGIANPYD